MRWVGVINQALVRRQKQHNDLYRESFINLRGKENSKEYRNSRYREEQN